MRLAMKDRYAGMSDNRLKFFFDKKGDVLGINLYRITLYV
jgi:hypothetical protein